ncbi:MAG: hypothetical protein M0009_12460 [Deltaproteobacteria bacterium]|nr:hypothetical protein [Deltaproteobacteria bacterium]
MTKAWGRAFLAVLFLSVLGCGGLRYSEVAPEAKGFHPRRIVVLPADAKTFPDAKGDIDRLFAETLEKKRWFAGVVGGVEIGRRLETDAELRQAVTGYLGKLDKVSFSDAELSSRIGLLTDTEALVLVRVDYWNYTTENDKTVGKVALSVTLVQAKTGKVLWTAGHQRVSDYLLIKPDLAGLAEGVIGDMIDHMPH